MESQWQQERMPAPPQPASSSKAARCRASSAWAAWICAESSQSWRPRSSAEASSSWRRGGWAMPQLYRKSVRQSGGARGDATVTWAWDPGAMRMARLPASLADGAHMRRTPFDPISRTRSIQLCGQSMCPPGQCAHDAGYQPAVDRALRSAGNALPPQTQHDMEARFRHSFAAVRIHADEHAAVAAGSVDARAFTVGSHIV